MSGDCIASLKMVESQPLNSKEVEYVEKLLDPFDPVDTVERFTHNPNDPISVPIDPALIWSRKAIMRLIGLVVVLIINFPKVRDKINLNPYLVWVITTLILMGVFY
ncbi:hypothetical protein MIV126R [Invertebrate iridescent virus 3]|uniref:Uncharacterized protein 126R n=1 Tax=Invertebrate iridescent virus 3 TaxID=345201 RepID=126R_IIV3|nr:hypothetical protein MIV126R [Invertebrate iridescent virus 3]Q196T4.1 RecName: Full=Uncharacterized protein 126R [Invertebrate iridescent virus 3]ABF82156.1 hypothetical protein MIV126R [Invertebrate iridescent virus 3]